MYLVSLFVLLVTCISISTAKFSGFYQPVSGKGVNDSGSEDFAAAWLLSRQRLLSSDVKIRSTAGFSMASVTFAVVRNPCAERNCISLLTRDYFDYMVEHLSSTSNRIPHGSKIVYNITIGRLQETAKSLRRLPVHHDTDPRQKETLAILVFCTTSFSATATAETYAIRLSYFEVTFWSAYRHFSKIDIFVSNPADEDIVKAMGLPYRQLRTIEAPLDHKKRPVGLVRLSLEFILDQLKSEAEDWQWMKYLYFTEGDQVLHLRTTTTKHLYDAIDTSRGAFVMVPHRMQTLPLKHTFPSELHRLWDTQRKNGQANIPAEVEIVVENLDQLSGSCCDAGRNVYEPCTGGGWWYTCNDWGLANFTHWFRVGKTGLTFLPSSEHKGVCSYTAHQRLCDIPPDCKYRVPKMINRVQHRECLQMPRVNYIVNYTAQMEREREWAMTMRRQKWD